MLKHPEVVVYVCIFFSLVSIINLGVALAWLNSRKKKKKDKPLLCYLCEEREPVVRLWGFHTCASCQMLYDGLLYYTVVEHNEYARKALTLAVSRLRVLNVGSLTRAAARAKEKWGSDDG